jgi:Protein of unknown function (DUF1583) C domain
VRSGAIMSFFAAAGNDGEFEFVEMLPFGAENVRAVSLVAQTGGPNATIDVRFTDLRIRAAGFPPPGPFVSLTPPQKQYADEFRLPLRERVESVNGFELIGPGKEQNVQLEALGLHVSLPAGWGGERPSSGMISTFGLKGDFDVSVRFELLNEPKQEDAGASGGTRLNLALVKDTPASDVSNINRTMSVKSGRIFYAWSTPTINPNSGKKSQLNQTSTTEAMSGRLRLVRSGADWYYGAAEADGEFKFFAKYPFGAEDIRQVRLIVATGGDQAAVEVRFSDLHIKADSIPDKPNAPVRAGPQDGAQAPVAGGGWLTPIVVILVAMFVLMLITAIGLLYVLKRRGIPAKKEAPAAPAKSAASGNYVSFPCSECGKNLKVKIELAGKKLKCPHCGTVTKAPASAAPKA